MKILQRLSTYKLLFYLCLGAFMLRRHKVEGKRKKYQINKEEVEFITAKLKQSPPFAAKAKIEGDAALFVWIILGLFLLHSISKSSKNDLRSISPLADRFLSSLLSEEKRECLIGDLQEEYGVRLELVGVVRAKAWLYRQVFNSIRPLAYEAIKVKLSSWLWRTVR